MHRAGCAIADLPSCTPDCYSCKSITPSGTLDFTTMAVELVSTTGVQSNHNNHLYANRIDRLLYVRGSILDSTCQSGSAIHGHCCCVLVPEMSMEQRVSIQKATTIEYCCYANINLQAPPPGPIWTTPPYLVVPSST